MHYPVLSDLPKGSLELREYLPSLLLGQHAIEMLLDIDTKVGELAMFEHKIEVSFSLFEVYELDDVLMFDDG